MSQHFPAPDFTDKATGYVELDRQLRALLAGERDLVANAANTAALLWHALPGLNWAGFYLGRDDELVLGPFQGKPACVRIAVGPSSGRSRPRAHRAMSPWCVNQLPTCPVPQCRL